VAQENSTKHTEKTGYETGQTEPACLVVFLRHPARKWSGCSLSTRSPTRSMKYIVYDRGTGQTHNKTMKQSECLLRNFHWVTYII